MIAMAVETFVAIQDELPPLWRAHYAEIAEDKIRVPLDPDWDKYRALDAAGHLVIVTARRAARLIGYVFAVVDTHLHYRSTLFGVLDLYYVAPAYRGGRTAWRLFKAIEAALAARGVVKIIGHTKLAHDHSRLFKALGWRQAEALFVKTVGAA